MYKVCLTVVQTWDAYACENTFLMIAYLYKQVLRVAVLTGIIVKIV